MKRPILHSLFALTLLLATAPLYAAGMGILKGFDGTFHTLDEYTGQGQWTVVMLWASYCPVCNEEAGGYVKFHEAHKDKDAAVVGISLDGMDNKADAEAFIQRHGVTFPNLIEEPDTVIKLYASLSGQNTFGTPSFLVFNPKGELRAAQTGAVPTSLIETFIEKESKGQ
jgi:peroxiredoxin